MPTFRAIALATLIFGVFLRVPTFTRPLLSDDEAIYAVTADALQRGDLLYRDVVDHKPPLIYHLYQAAFAGFGRYQMQGPHALVVLAVLMTAGFLFAIKRRDGSIDARDEALAAAGLYLIFSTTWHDYDALAANCELFLLAPQAIAAWLLLRDLRAHSRGEPASSARRVPSREGAGTLSGFPTETSGVRALATHLAIGLLIGTSALLKVQGIMFLGASVGMLVWWALRGRVSWTWVGTRALLQVTGALAPPALYLAWCSAAGNAADAIYWFRFNFSYVGAGLGGGTAIARGLQRTLMIGGAALVPYALGLAAAFGTASRMIRFIRRRRRGPADAANPHPPATSAVLGLLWLATSAVAVTAGGRFFGHYFHLVLAPLCLLAAPACCRLWNRGWSRRGPLVALCAVPALTFFALATFARPLAAAIDEREPPYDEVAARIAAVTPPDEPIFVWGNSPQLYVLARRPMGARFSSSNFVTGESPGTPTETGAWNADLNQSPERWEMLYADLERRRPGLFVDAAAAGWDGYARYPIARYPRLRAYVEQHYRQLDVLAGVVLYVRLR